MTQKRDRQGHPPAEHGNGTQMAGDRTAVLVPDEQEWTAIRSFLAGDAVPTALQNLIEQFIVRKIDKDWNEPVILDRIRRAIVAQKDRYWNEKAKKPITYRGGYSVIAYLAYQFPVYYLQFANVFSELAAAGLLKKEMVIVDAGSGPGVVPLAVIDLMKRMHGCHATIHAIEQSEEHREAYRYLVERYAKEVPAVTVTPPLNQDITKVKPEDLPESIDLLVFSNVLNELHESSIADRADLIRAWSARLAPDGIILLIEPAERVASSDLRKTTQALAAAGLSIYSPCPDLWRSRCSCQDCWTFEERRSIRPTWLMEVLADDPEGYRYLNTDIKFSSAIIRKDQKTRRRFEPLSEKKYARFSHLASHENRRVSCAAMRMSSDLGDAKSHVFLLCDGTSPVPVFAVLPSYHETEENRAIRICGYGEGVVLQGVLVRQNRKTGAYNLLISKESKVIPFQGDQQD
jgi:SAM-dependent methyltransferase